MELRDIAHNLTLLFAFSVLEGVLLQMRREGVFSSSRAQLGTLMHESKDYLGWVDFGLVDNARKDRNRVAHDQIVLGRGKVWEYIDGIETELISWRVLSAPISLQH